MVLFFVYALHAAALPHKDLGSPDPIIAVWFIVNIVQLARSAMTFVSPCQSTVSLRIIPLCLNAAASSEFATPVYLNLQDLVC